MFPSVPVKIFQKAKVIKTWYSKGWSVTGPDKDWSYRLSIYYAKPLDSNVFECKTPRGLTNRISLVVTGKF